MLNLLIKGFHMKHEYVIFDDGENPTYMGLQDGYVVLSDESNDLEEFDFDLEKFQKEAKEVKKYSIFHMVKTLEQMGVLDKCLEK